MLMHHKCQINATTSANSKLVHHGCQLNVNAPWVPISKVARQHFQGNKFRGNNLWGSKFPRQQGSIHKVVSDTHIKFYRVKWSAQGPLTWPSYVVFDINIFLHFQWFTMAKIALYIIISLIKIIRCKLLNLNSSIFFLSTYVLVSSSGWILI